MSVDRLSELAPELMIGDVIRDQAGTVSRPSLKNTEVMFPHYWTDLQGIVKTSSKSAVRAYLVWQIFLQTQHLLEHWTVEDYRNILREIDGTVCGMCPLLLRNAANYIGRSLPQREMNNVPRGRRSISVTL